MLPNNILSAFWMQTEEAIPRCAEAEWNFYKGYKDSETNSLKNLQT